MNAKRNRARLGVERLDDRFMPSAVLGQIPAHVASAVSHRVAAREVAVAKPRVERFQLMTKITSDGSTDLKISGAVSGLGRYGGGGTVENIAYDPVLDRISAAGKATFVFKNGAKLFVSFSVSLSQKTHLGLDSIEITGGTGRFVGANGGASSLCRSSGDPSTPLIFECNSKGTGFLLLARR
jgi:hypothetical protein